MSEASIPIPPQAARWLLRAFLLVAAAFALLLFGARDARAQDVGGLVDEAAGSGAEVAEEPATAVGSGVDDAAAPVGGVTSTLGSAAQAAGNVADPGGQAGGQSSGASGAAAGAITQAVTQVTGGAIAPTTGGTSQAATQAAAGAAGGAAGSVDEVVDGATGAAGQTAAAATGAVDQVVVPTFESANPAVHGLIEPVSGAMDELIGAATGAITQMLGELLSQASGALDLVARQLPTDGIGTTGTPPPPIVPEPGTAGGSPPGTVPWLAAWARAPAALLDAARTSFGAPGPGSVPTTSDVPTLPRGAPVGDPSPPWGGTVETGNGLPINAALLAAATTLALVLGRWLRPIAAARAPAQFVSLIERPG